MKNKRATIIGLAKELSISASTVSRSLNNNLTIGGIKKKVKDLAKKRNYHPNLLVLRLDAKNKRLA